MSERAETKKRCISHNPYSRAIQCQGAENHEGPHFYHGISWLQTEKPVMQVQLTEADLHIISYALSQVSNETVEQIYHRGRMYGMTDPKQNHINALYQRLMSEWERWSKDE